MSRDGRIRSEPVALRFGQNLWRCRRGVGLSQEELGELAFLHRAEVGLLERGSRIARVDTVMKLAGALSIPVTDLLEGIEWIPGSRFEIHDPHNPPQKGLGKAIEVLRRSRQMSPAELATHSELDRQELEGIEQGKLEPTWGSMLRVAKSLDVPFPEFCELAEQNEGRLESRVSSEHLQDES